MSIKVCPDDIFSVCPIVSTQYNLNCWTIFYQTGMVVYYHEAMGRAEKLVLYFQDQRHSKGLYNKNITISVISSKVVVGLQPNLAL